MENNLKINNKTTIIWENITLFQQSIEKMEPFWKQNFNKLVNWRNLLMKILSFSEINSIEIKHDNFDTNVIRKSLDSLNNILFKEYSNFNNSKPLTFWNYILSDNIIFDKNSIDFSPLDKSMIKKQYYDNNIHSIDVAALVHINNRNLLAILYELRDQKELLEKDNIKIIDEITDEKTSNIIDVLITEETKQPKDYVFNTQNIKNIWEKAKEKSIEEWMKISAEGVKNVFWLFCTTDTPSVITLEHGIDSINSSIDSIMNNVYYTIKKIKKQIISILTKAYSIIQCEDRYQEIVIKNNVKKFFRSAKDYVVNSKLWYIHLISKKINDKLKKQTDSYENTREHESVSIILSNLFSKQGLIDKVHCNRGIYNWKQEYIYTLFESIVNQVFLKTKKVLV